ncbi:GTPase ObgE [Candidatus Gracilibacteria bacterium]|nr:GTPase ObgE [Candidatus Gracilibacteria bacterium]
MFIDEVKVTLIAGKGGDGLVSWRREKFMPKGGPYGGNGGKGGDIILNADSNINTLSEFRHKKVIKAGSGERGQIKIMTGAYAEDIIINLPVGTLVKDAKTGELIYDLNKNKDRFVICKGGRGGYGNAHFISSIRQAPNFAELGDVGEEKTVIFELKLVADIGLIGLPNAGKSTLIKTITNVKPKIAPYPFTTIIPNLGVMEHKGKSLIIEDTPGLIKGASTGKGLGINFLKHIERTKVLVHLLDIQELDKIEKNYLEIRKELKIFSDKLAKKEEIIILTKADLFDKEMIDFIKKDLTKKLKKKQILVISTITHENIEELKNFLIDKYCKKQIRNKNLKTENGKGKIEDKEIKIYDLKMDKDKNDYEIKDLGNMTFEIKGERIEQIVRMTDMNNKDAVLRIYDILDKIGAIKKINSLLKKKYGNDLKELRQSESKNNSTVIISGKEFIINPFFFQD